MSAYIKKMELMQKQHVFPVVAWCQSSDSRTSQFEFQIQRSQPEEQPVWSGDPLQPTRPRQVTPHRNVNPINKRKAARKTAPLAAAEGAKWFWNQNTHLAPGGYGWVLVSNHVVESEDSSNFGIRTQDQSGKQRGNVHLQGRTESRRVRVSQLISPLVFLSLGMSRRQHVSSLVDLW